MRLPERANALMVDEGRDGTVEQLISRRVTLAELDEMFRNDREQFADGAARILSRDCLAAWINW